MSEEDEVVQRAPAVANIMDIPPSYIPVGWEYGWVRLCNGDEYDAENCARALKNGWRPVPGERHKDTRFQFYNYTNHRHFPNFFFFKGSLLCERLKEAPVPYEADRLFTQLLTAVVPQLTKTRTDYLPNC
jgi:hypothetical protein